MATFIILALCIVATQGHMKHVHELEIPLKKDQPLNLKDQSLDLNMLKDLSHLFHQKRGQTSSGLKLKSFFWKDCGTASALVNIKSLSLSPDPLAFPGPVNVAASFTVKQTLNAPLKGQLKVYKKIFGTYIMIPCIDNVGSCTYKDLCAMLATIQSQCPEPMQKIGISCSCPIAANSYNLGKTEFYVSASSIPGGDYRIKAYISMNGAQASCIDIYISVE